MDYNIEQTTLFPLEQAYRVVTRRADALLQRMLGCGRREMWILLIINAEGRSQREVGEKLGAHPNVVVKLLDKMEESGLVRRVRRIEDRREQMIESTAKGHVVLQKFLHDKDQILAEIFSPLTAAQREQGRQMALLILKGAASVMVAVMGLGFTPDLIL